MPKLPYLVSRLFFLAAALLVAESLLPGVFWLSAVVDGYSTLFFPIDGGTIGFAIFLLILGGALARRKQAGWVIAMVIFSVALLGDLVVVVGGRAAGDGDRQPVDYALAPRAGPVRLQPGRARAR